MFFIYVG